MKNRCFTGLLAATVALFAVGQALQAATVPLSQLLEPNATIEVGDKIFSDFSYNKTGDMPTADQVNVITLDAGPDYGLRFQGGFLDRTGGSSSDALITYNISVKPGSNMQISQAKLLANPAVFNGPGLASVTETFLPLITDDKMVVYDFGNGDDKLADSISFAQPLTTFPMQKDIILHATGENGAVTLSFVDQIFVQVPEPSAIALMLVGLTCLVGIRRRRG